MVRNPDRIVFVCNGPDCRKHKAERKKLVALAREYGVELTVGCQKICKGPVVGIAVEAELGWESELGWEPDALASLFGSVPWLAYYRNSIALGTVQIVH